ncbi:DUF4236 domain-containing protein [Belnapia rosea]|uniref:DUF4236 domain-containing protein n=1 Tax=Belnapia rosea TaxID=938405 RepID=UPI00088B5514|nr:SH3 domain-containing protein [Belnapia rosea]
MGWRFRKSFKLLPGVRVNVGSKGVTSWSFGRRGARVNVGKRGTTTTYSLFGTGLSYRTHTPRARPAQPTITVNPGPQITAPAPKSASTKRSPAGVYALVGMAAVVTYFVLKPESPRSQDRATSVQANHHAPDGLRSSPPPLPAAVASAAAATPRGVAPSAPAGSVYPGEAVTTTGANVRSSASMSGSVVRVLDAGTRVRVMGQEGSWRRVGDPGGEPWGWVHNSILR